MKEFLFFMWDEGFIGKLFAILFCVLVVCVLTWVGLLLFGVSDSLAMSEKKGTATIIEKIHNNASTTTTFIQLGKVIVPQVYNVPESWSVRLKMEDGKEDTFSCSEGGWCRTSTGEKVAIRFKCGRFSNRIYITEVEWEKQK